MHRQTFHLISRADKRIAATIFAPVGDQSAEPCPAVICAHGLIGSRSGSCYRFARLGRRLSEHGIACVTFDFRGCGESDGEFIDVTCERLEADLRAVVDWTTRREEIDPARIGLCGSSFGAFTAARASRHIPGLKALVFWAGVASPKRLFDRAMNADAWKLLGEQGWLDHRGMPLGHKFFSLAPEDDDGPEALAQSGCPTLLFHASGDQEVPMEHSQAYEAALRKAKIEARLEVLDLPDHGMRNVESNRRILEETVQWFIQRL